MVLTEFEKEALAEVSKKRCWEHVEWFAKVGEKLSGTPSNERSVDYVVGVLEGYGVGASAPEFQAWLGFPKMFDAELKVLEPESRTLRGIALAQIKSTPAAGVEGEMIYVGGGGLGDYEGKNAQNKITLVDFGKPPARPWKNYVASVLKGAMGQIVVGHKGPQPVLNRGTVKSVWGNPTPETMDDIGRIPVVNVSAEDGEYLKRLLERGPVRVWMKAEGTRGWMRTRQPMARIKGKEKEFVLLGSHLDAWGAAASCNAVGCASTLETARVVQKYRPRLRRGLELLWFQGHETGIMTGSTWYVDSFWDDLHGNSVAYLNNDTPSMIHTTIYTANGDPILRDFLVSTVKELAEAEGAPFREPTTRYVPRKTGDQSFYGLGIPSARVQITYPPEAAYDIGAPGGWWYHSDQDNLDKVDPETLHMANKAQILVILRLCTLPLLPFKAEPVADWMIDILGELDGKAEGMLNLSDLVQKASLFKEMTSKLDEATGRLSLRFVEGAERDEEMARVANHCLMKISRILNPVNYTLRGKYDQDYYGAEYVKPIPVLQPVAELPFLNPDTSEYKALKTKLVRARNAVSDALREALWITDYTLKRIAEP